MSRRAGFGWLVRVPEHAADQGAARAGGRAVPVLSDVLPTAWQAVQYADVPAGGTLAVLGLGPIGD